MEIKSLLIDHIKHKYPQATMLDDQNFGFYIEENVKLYVHFTHRYIYVNLEFPECKDLTKNHVHAFFSGRLEAKGTTCRSRIDGVYLSKISGYSSSNKVGVFKEAMEYYILFDTLYRSYHSFKKLTTPSV